MRWKLGISIAFALFGALLVVQDIDERRAEARRKEQAARQAEIARCENTASRIRAALGHGSEIETNVANGMDGLTQAAAWFLSFYGAMPSSDPRASASMRHKAQELAQQQIEREKLRTQLQGVNDYLDQLRKGFPPRRGIC